MNQMKPGSRVDRRRFLTLAGLAGAGAAVGVQRAAAEATPDPDIVNLPPWTQAWPAISTNG